jgi:hypothetical protein
MLVRSLRDLRKLKLKLKHDEVQVTRAGGYFRARFHGHANCVMASTAHEARQRLLDSPSRCVRNDKQNSEVRANRNRGNDKQ